MTRSAESNGHFDMNIDGVIEQKDLIKGNAQIKF